MLCFRMTLSTGWTGESESFTKVYPHLKNSLFSNKKIPELKKKLNISLKAFESLHLRSNLHFKNLRFLQNAFKTLQTYKLSKKAPKPVSDNKHLLLPLSLLWKFKHLNFHLQIPWFLSASLNFAHTHSQFFLLI